MVKYLLAALLALCPIAAYAQSVIVINQSLSGDPIGSGYALSNGELFIPASSSLNALKLPMSFSFDAVTPQNPSPTTNADYFLTNGSGTTGFLLAWNGATGQDGFHIQSILRQAGATACDASSTGWMCWRSTFVIDKSRHNYCFSFDATNSYLYIDGILRDQANSGTFTNPTTGFWEIGRNWPQTTTGTVFYDVRVFSKALTGDDCVNASRLNQAGLVPNSGTLNTNLLANWRLSDCSGTLPERACPDVINSNTATNAKIPPVVVVTAPSSGTQPPGAISMQATCTDPSGTLCTQVCYLVDNVQVSASCPTTAPFTFSWDSTKIIDGSHTITAVGFNIASVTGTSAGVSITTANSISAKTVSVNSATGSDSNNCVSAPCLTMARVQSVVTFLGGDTFNIVGTFTDAATFKICGPLSGCATQNFYPSGATLTITTTGGACNPFTETTTGCGIINVTSAAGDGIQIINGANVTVTNLAVQGPAAVPLANMGIHVISSLPAYTSSNGITITNNIVNNFGYLIYLNGSTTSTVTGYMVSDNWATSTPVHVNPGPLTCIRADAGTSGTIQGNLATQCGGQSGNNGNGILAFNFPGAGGATTTMQFNVVHDFGWNDAPNNGGPVGIYSINADKVLIQFNESYNGLPNPLGNAIDFDCFDIDNGSTNVTVQYNYAHNCPNQSAFNISTNGFTSNPGWNNNVIRYNIGENNLQCVTFGGNSLQTNSFIYNNTCSTNLATFGTGTSICWNLPGAITLVNNLCIYTGTAQTGYINFAYGGLPITNQVVIQNNDYWATSASAANPPVWVYNKLFNAPQLFTSLSAYQMASIDANHPLGLDANSLNVDPQLTGTAGTGGTCYTDASGSPPAGPQPCPSAYKLSGSSPLKTAGVNVATLPSTAGTPPANPSVDYYGAPVGPINFSIGASSGQ